MRIRRSLAVPAAVAGWLVVPATVVAMAALDRDLVRIGRSDLTAMHPDAVVFVVAMASAATVGAALVASRPRHPVGWLFLGLATSLAVNAAGTSYALTGRPGGGAVATVANAAFIAWLVLIALVLYVTPTGRAVSTPWSVAARATAAGGVLWFGIALVRPGRMDPPLEGIANPWAIPGSGPVLDVAGRVVGIATAAGVVLGAASLFARFRHATGDERARLWWMVLAAVPLPISVAGAFVASYYGNEEAVYWASAGFVALIPVAAGLSVVRYRLYDVDRIVSRALTWLIVSAVLAASYVAAVFAVGQVLGGLAGRSRAAAVAATLVAVAVAAPSYRRIQDGLDRRFNRRRFDALRVVRRFARDPVAGVGVEEVLRTALGDPGLTVAYWIDSRRQWVNADGHEVAISAAAVEVRRHDRPVARITTSSDRPLVEAAAGEAASELDNAGLRADLALRLVEVSESRARIAAAQLAERSAIERDLHDGAQQRLLALALQLRAAHGNGDAGRLRDTVEHGIQELQAAVIELRELASGLCPAALTSGGLGAALDELAARTPVPIAVRTPERRFPPAVETTAWFIACESITNAVKHAGPDRIEVIVTHDHDRLRVRVTDDGVGGADPGGRGLRGIRDRAEALGGELTVVTGRDGTTIGAELPCAS
jgi:signal transduction histidine kinase